MSGSQKALKVISIIMIVMAVIGVGFGALMMGGSQADSLTGSFEVNGSAIDLRSGVLAVGFVIAISAVVNLIIGICGLIGASNPQKIGPFLVLSIVGVVWYGFNFISGLVLGSGGSGYVLNLILVVVCLVLALNIRKLRA